MQVFRGVLVFKVHRLLYEEGSYFRFIGGLVFKAHRLVHHSTLGLRVIKKKKKKKLVGGQ